MSGHATEHAVGHVTPCVIVHGGASTLRNSNVFPMLVNGVKKAARTGYNMLMKGGDHAAVNAVEAAVKVRIYLYLCVFQNFLKFTVIGC